MITVQQPDRWKALESNLVQLFQKEMDINAILFLIGVQELGKGNKVFSKEEKQDLMHIAICKVLSLSGYYELAGEDEDGWPHWDLVKKLPFLDILEQEEFLKYHILEYFEQETTFFQ